MGYPDRVATRWEVNAASRFNNQFRWFSYSGPASENQILKWKAYNPGPYPAPHAEIYQKYAVDRYAEEILQRLELSGGVMLWGTTEGIELIKTEKRLEMKYNGALAWFFIFEGDDPAKGVKHGDMGTFSLFRFGWMVGDVNLDSYLMSEEEKFQDSIDKAMAKMDLPAYKGNPKAFTGDTGFLVTSMDLEPIYNGDVFIGYKSVMNVDWSQQVNTKKPGIGQYS